MERGLKAFFYDYKYYLFPDGVHTLKELRAKSSVTARRLKEELCMAPAFVYESIVEETVEFEDPDRIFEVAVDLYTAAEYDAILKKQVDRVCPGCVNYSEEGEGLDGHHREISLTGTCYLREDEDEQWDLLRCIEAFWYNISDSLNDLAECIDKNDQKKLNKILNKELENFFFELEFVGTVYNGKYTLCFVNYGGAPTFFYGIFSMFADVAMDERTGIMRQNDWNVLPYRPAGAIPYDKKTDIEVPIVRLEKLPVRMEDRHRDEEEIVSYFELYIYHPGADKLTDKAKEKLFGEMQKYLVFVAGENAFLQMIHGIGFTSDDSGLCSLREAGEQIRAGFARILASEDEDGPLYPPRAQYGTDPGYGDAALPFRKNLRFGMTSCVELSWLATDTPDEEKWWLDLVSFAYIVLPNGDDGAPVTALGWYLANLEHVPEPIIDVSYALGSRAVGVGSCGDDGVVIDRMVFSEKKFFRNMREIAPVLIASKAKIVLVNKDGATAYECGAGYDFSVIDG